MRHTAKPASSCSIFQSAGLFFVVVFAWSWSFWLVAAALGVSVNTPLGNMLMHTGLLGPMLGGIGFTYFTRSRDEWWDYWRRIVDPRLIPVQWFVVILLFTPMLPFSRCCSISCPLAPRCWNRLVYVPHPFALPHG